MSWDDDQAELQEQARAKARRRAEMITTIDKALAMVILGGISISNSFGWTHVAPDTAANINAGLAALAPVLVWLIPNKAAK